MAVMKARRLRQGNDGADRGLVYLMVFSFIALTLMNDLWSFICRRPKEERLLSPHLFQCLRAALDEIIFRPIRRALTKEARLLRRELARQRRRERRERKRAPVA